MALKDIFRAKTHEEIKSDLTENFFYVNGDLYTNFPFDMELLHDGGMKICVSGNVYLSSCEDDVPEGGIWIPHSRLPSKIGDIIAFSDVFIKYEDMFEHAKDWVEKHVTNNEYK